MSANPIVEAVEARGLLSTIAPAPIPVPTTGADVGPGADHFVPLFDGPSTAGWSVSSSSGRAFARGDEIRLVGPQKFFLVSQATYRNFILEGDILIPRGGNSGIQFWSQARGNGVSGYQADVDTQPRNWAGGLWSQKSGWVARPHHPAKVVPGHWNHYRVEAVDGDVRIFVNGEMTVEAHVDPPTDGHLALQDHGGSGVYRFRNFRIESLDGGSPQT